MSLSKYIPALPSNWQCSGKSAWLFGEPGDIVLRKIADPWVELYNDGIDSVHVLVEGGRQLLNSTCVVKGLGNLAQSWADFHDDDEKGRSEPISGKGSRLSHDCYLRMPKHVQMFIDAASLRICRHPLTRAMNELAEDSGRFWAPLLCLALCGPTAGTSLVFATTTLTQHFTFIIVGGLLYLSINIFYGNSVAATTGIARRAHLRTMSGLVITGVMYGFFACGGLEQSLHLVGLSDFSSFHIAQPMLFVYFCKDLLVYPLMLVNIQTISMVPSSTMVRPIILVSMGSALAAVSCTTLVPTASPILTNFIAFCCMAMATQSMATFPQRATAVGVVNKYRTDSAMWSTIFWWAPELVVLVARLGLADLENVVPVVTILDIFSKISVSHITLKSRTVLDNAAKFAGEEG